MSRLLAKLFPKRFNARSSLTELASGLWSIDERLGPMLDEISHHVSNATVTELAEAEMDDEHECECEEGEECDCDEYMKVENGVAHIPIDGLLVSRGAQIFRFFGVAATGYNEISAALSSAERRDDVKQVVLHVNSPGGSVTGLQSTASKIFSLRRKKPVSAHASGIVASAAYWLASQAGWLTADEGTEVGSIGVYATVEDSSRLFEDTGIKVHMIRSGEHKGVGEPGVPVTDRQLNKIQKQVNRSAAEFMAAVSRGRDMKLSEVERLATGETWQAKDAADHRLIDQVDAVEEIETTSEIKQQAPGGAHEQEDRMSKDPAVDLAAIKAELLAEVRQDFDSKLAETEKKNESKLAEAYAAIAGLKEDRKKSLISAATKDGRIAPASLAAIERFAAAATDEELEGFLVSLPKQTNPDMVGSSGGSANRRHRYVSDGETHLANLLGLDPASLSGPLSDAQGILTDGRVVLADGSIVSAKEVMN